MISKTFEIQKEEFWQMSKRQTDFTRLKKIFKILRLCSIEPILIKGWAAAKNYPPQIYREYVDFDLAVSREQFAGATEILQSDRNLNVQVDLHCELRHLDTMPWADLFAGSVLIGEDFDAVRILRAEDHLRIMSVHWLTDGGAYRERLWDIFFAVKNRPEDFDWNRLLNSVSKERRQWILDTFFLIRYYFNADFSGTPIDHLLSERKFPLWITKQVEKNWSSEKRLKPLSSVLRKPEEWWSQVKLRIPPNPIFATVLNEGAFDEKSRAIYQLRNFSQRLLKK